MCPVGLPAGPATVGGWAIVSEPPQSGGERWPTAALAELGFGPAQPVVARDRSYVGLRKQMPAEPGIPRATRRLVKHPAW